MATAAEITFRAAVIKAESVRQTAKASAFTTYGFVPANLAAYLTALEAADNTFMASVNSAASTLGAAGIGSPFPPAVGNVSIGAAGFSAATDLGAAPSTLGGVA
jgi:hypothetical protein